MSISQRSRSRAIRNVAILGDTGVPTNEVAPVVTGTANVGQTLSCSTGTWTGSPSFTYQWKRDGVDIGGATANTYLLADMDILTSISCLVTATNVNGSASQISNSVSVTLTYNDIAASLYLYNNHTVGMPAVNNIAGSTINKISKQLYLYNNFK